MIENFFWTIGNEKSCGKGIAEESLRPYDSHALFATGRIAGFGVEDVMITDTLPNKTALVIAGGGRSQIGEHKDGGKPILSWMLNADLPKFVIGIFSPAIKVSPSIDKAILDAHLNQRFCSHIDAKTFGDAPPVKFHSRGKLNMSIFKADFVHPDEAKYFFDLI